MGSELLTEEAPLPVKSYTEQFYEVFPMYLNMGMTYELFWMQDASLPRFYREAHKLKQKHENYSAWLQGAYIYDALCAVSPLLHAFAQKGTKPQPYHKLPYGEKPYVDPVVAKEEFLAKWKANKAIWKARNKI